jgi:O-antigen/teichoic acid export membrane protein
MNVGAIEHRAARVSLVTGLSTVLAVGFQLVSVPVCLHYWGKESYGSWLALFSAFMLLRSLDGGFTAFVGNKLNYLYHQNIPVLREHLASAVFGIVIISGLELVLVAGNLVIEPLSAMLGMPADHSGGLLAKLGLLTLMISWVLSGSYLGIVHRLLIPAGLMYQAAWWAMGFQVCQFVAIMLAAVLRLSMLQTSLLFALAQFSIYTASALYVRHALPGFSPWLRGSKARIGLTDLGQSLLLTTSNLIQQSATNGAVLLVAALGGPIAVPVFTTVRTLTNLWTSVTTVLSSPLLPDVVRLHAKGEVQKLVSVNKAFWVLIGSSVNLGALLSYPLIPFLYGQWTSHTVVLDKPLLCLLLGSVVVANAGALMALHLNGINSLRIVLRASVARAVLSLGGGALGFNRYGLASFGVGILAGEIVATLMTARYFVKHEVTAKSSRISLSDVGPIVLSTGSVLLFFTGAAFGMWSIGWAWPCAIGVVVCASIWGWTSLEADLQLRVKGMVFRALPR